MVLQNTCRIVTLIPLLLFAPSLIAGTNETIYIDGSTGVKPLVEALAKHYQEKKPEITIKVGNGMSPKKRIAALVTGKIDLAMASHGLEIEQLTNQGMVVRKIAKMAVVFGINSSVRISNLTEEQLCDIYSGKVTNWKNLGGPDLLIAPFARPEKEVDTEVVRNHISCFNDIEMSELVKVKTKSGDMAKVLSAETGAIGMTTMVRVEQSQGSIRSVSLNGKIPSTNNIMLDSYRLTRDSFLVMPSEFSQTVTSFMKFIKSADGEKIIINNNAMPAN